MDMLCELKTRFAEQPMDEETTKALETLLLGQELSGEMLMELDEAVFISKEPIDYIE